jgi:hypothetical protein
MIVAMGYRSARDASMKPIVAFVLMGVIGGSAGFLLALVVQPFPEHPITVAAPVLAVAAPFLVAAASIAGGVLAAWFLTLVILSWAPGRFRCPRCGIANTPNTHSCRACLLPFM